MRLSIRIHVAVLAASAVLFVVAGGVFLYCLVVSDPFFEGPHPVRTLRRHRSDIETYVESIYAGRIPERNGDKGYYILDVLGANEVTYVRKVEGCIVITFAFMPTDAVPELIYSPLGQQGLPAEYRANNGRWSFFQLTPIDEKWFYCLWDQ
jgi:hypothetical protein